MYYAECLPLNCVTLLRKATLGCLPRKTFVQETLVGPLACWNSYLHVTCIARPELKLKNCGIALLPDPRQRRKARGCQAFEFSFQTSAKQQRMCDPIDLASLPKSRNMGESHV